MSYRPPKTAPRRKSNYMRGASRPIDPRNAPGAVPPRRIDNFGIAMIAVSVVAVAILLFLLAIQNKGTTTAAVSPTAVPVANNPAALSADSTQTAVTFATETAPDILPRITITEAKALYDANNVKMIDVRVASIYNTEHIKGAINVPQADVAKRLADIPKTGNVIVYCDCPHDEESSGVSYSLRFSAGYTNVKILQGPSALELWKNAGYPVEP